MTRTLRTRLDAAETELHATIQRLTAVACATINRERSIPERRAFCRVARRITELRSAGVPCPTFPAEGDVIAGPDGARLPDGALLATADEWRHFRTIADRAAELWRELDGPDVGLHEAIEPDGTP